MIADPMHDACRLRDATGEGEGKTLLYSHNLSDAAPQQAETCAQLAQLSLVIVVVVVIKVHLQSDNNSPLETSRFRNDILSSTRLPEPCKPKLA